MRGRGKLDLPLFLRTEAFLFLKGGEPVEMDHPLAPEVRETVSRLMREIQFGSLTFTVQDGRIVQLERNETFQFPAVPPKVQQSRQVFKPATESLPGLAGALAGLRFGQVVVKFQAGRAIQIDRTEKRRWSDLMGIGGDGI